MKTTNEPTEAQKEIVAALDDAAEHLAWEFDQDEYQGISTIGFAHIANIDGRSSFVRRMKSAADGPSPNINENRRNEIVAGIGGVELALRPAHRGGYRMSITNVSSIMSGPEHQRLDVRERLHRLILERLQIDWGYLEDARVKSRMD